MHPLQGSRATGIKENSTRVNNTSSNNKEPKIKTDLIATIHDQVDETLVKVIEVIPSKAKKSPKYIYPPTQEELIPLFYDKLQDKKRSHPNIVDCWNWANMESEKFFLHWERKNWEVQKLGNAIATWVNGAITYGTVTKPCPIQYKGNPDTNKPMQPTKVHVEETVLTQSDIEAGSAHLAATKDVFAKMGVRV